VRAAIGGYSLSVRAVSRVDASGLSLRCYHVQVAYSAAAARSARSIARRHASTTLFMPRHVHLRVVTVRRRFTPLRCEMPRATSARHIRSRKVRGEVVDSDEAKEGVGGGDIQRRKGREVER